MNKIDNHTFTICAYKESKYLEECIESLKNQSVKSNIIMATSTPNDYIKKIADKYKIPLYINTGKSGIGEDWNYAVSVSNTELVTVAHQDDIYCEDYLENIIKEFKDNDTLIAFTNYGELRNGKKINKNTLLRTKRIMLFPLKFIKKSKFVKRLVLSFGNSICCPSVTLNTKKVGNKPFYTDLKCNLDWDTWANIAKVKGRFSYIPKILMYHRIHEESETSNLIENNIRIEEDYIMFQKFWPKWVVKLLMKNYSKSTNSNKVN